MKNSRRLKKKWSGKNRCNR